MKTINGQNVRDGIKLCRGRCVMLGDKENGGTTWAVDLGTGEYAPEVNDGKVVSGSVIRPGTNRCAIVKSTGNSDYQVVRVVTHNPDEAPVRWGYVETISGHVVVAGTGCFKHSDQDFAVEGEEYTANDVLLIMAPDSRIMIYMDDGSTYAYSPATGIQSCAYRLSSEDDQSWGVEPSATIEVAALPHPDFVELEATGTDGP